MADRVLLVEDRENLRVMLEAALRASFAVEAVADAETALALLDSAPFDVVVTDVRLPGASGRELLRTLRERDEPPEVVLMTGYAAVPDAVDALRGGRVRLPRQTVRARPPRPNRLPRRRAPPAVAADPGAGACGLPH
jgi:DNA-binding NtrC family response regulator